MVLEIEDPWDRYKEWEFVPTIKAYVDGLDVRVVEDNCSTELIESDEDAPHSSRQPV